MHIIEYLLSILESPDFKIKKKIKLNKKEIIQKRSSGRKQKELPLPGSPKLHEVTHNYSVKTPLPMTGKHTWWTKETSKTLRKMRKKKIVDEDKERGAITYC